jgi:hypothetical protein
MKKEKTPKEPTPILENISLAKTAKFSIVEIKMKNDWRWKIKMLVHEILPRTHHDYAVKLEFDDAPYLKTIEQLKNEAEELRTTPTLLPDIDARSLKDLDRRIVKAEQDMANMQRACTDIEFVGQTEEIKWKDGDTALLFKVLDTVIQPLNEQKFRLTEYRAILDPIIP